jgi:hypothetical protein
MLTPNVTENLSAHRRELERVRRSLIAVPEPPRAAGRFDPRDPLRRIAPRHARVPQDHVW